MNLDQFVASRNGQQNISFDGITANAGQCVQLVAFYVRDVIHKPVIWADAAAWWNRAAEYPNDYERIPNIASAVPQRGDIVIWSGSLPNSGGAGHIAICLQPFPGTGTFTTFDTNWSGKYAHAVTHNYTYVIGWLRPKTAAAPAPAPVTSQGDSDMAITREDIVREYRVNRGADPSEAEINGHLNGGTMKSLSFGFEGENNNRRQQTAEQMTNLNRTINQLNQTITDLRGVASQDALNDIEVARTLDEAHAKIALLTTQLETAHDKLQDLQTAPPPVPPAPPVSPVTKVIASIVRAFTKKS